ncbi:Taxadiene 5-alpha hydroxylase [Tripterygium wilfordii]|uniref:Taxadiene 5-alpha hydroxylase n=1 Tax=Tripterygium wilfordii TaxID=458696 RepID=A0A7J7C8T1_TRIWF|nr:Taxadiene 5-alpha hydroxylase [Tripterygium wilfordii]
MKKRRSSKRLPPGSLGLPFIGQSLGLLRAMRANTAEKWLEQRIKRYGPISKLSLFGKPTVFVYGQAANKLVFASDSSMISNKQVKSIRMILGDRNILELSGQDHKRIRDALMMFLKPESLKVYVGKIDEEVRKHLQMHWQGKQEITIFWVASMTHNDDTIFPEPWKFDPSRFEKQASIPPYCFVAFGGGARICPGYEFARIETLVTIHYLVTRYTWKLCSDNFFRRDPMPVPSKGLPIKIVPRKFM